MNDVVKNSFYMFLNLLIISNINLHAELPLDLKEYLIKELPPIEEYLPLEYSQEQVKLILERLSNLLVQKFHKSIALTPSFSERELYLYLKNSIPIKEIKQSSENPEMAKMLQREDVNLLKQSFSGEIKGSFMEIKYDGLIIPIKISESKENHDLQLRLIGVPINLNEISVSCLTLDINSKKKSAYIEWLGTANSACPIPGELAGKFLVNLAENIAKYLQLKEINLHDKSDVICKENQAKVSLRSLKIFQNGRSWYESLGYAPETEEKKSEYSDQIKNILSYEIPDLLKELDKVRKTKVQQAIYEARPDHEKLYFQDFFTNRDFVRKKLYEFMENNDSKKVSVFMSWLYKKSCEDYKRIYDFLIPIYYYPINFTIASLMPKETYLIKKL